MSYTFKNKKQVFLTIVTIVVIALVALIVDLYVGYREYFKEYNYASVPASTDTSNWNTYRNEKYGFEFKYPEDWKETKVKGYYDTHIVFVKSSMEEPLKSHIQSSRSTAMDGGIIGGITFVLRMADSNEINSFVVDLKKHATDYSDPRIRFSEVRVGDMVATKFFGDGGSGGTSETYVFKNDTIGVIFGANYLDDKVPSGELKTVFDGVLLTFKFTK